MSWVLVVKNLEEGKWEVISEGKEIGEGDMEYGFEVHVVPVTEREEGGVGLLSFGVHEFRRDCCCHPEMRLEGIGREKVIHNERVN